MIRRYTKRDFPKIKRLCKEEKYFNDFKIFFKDPHYIIFIYIDNSKIIGTIVVSRELDNLNANYLYIDPKIRGKGIGTKLLKHIEAYAKNKKFVGVRIDTGIENKKVIALYKRLGYKKTGQVKNYFTNSGEQYFLWKKISKK